MVYNQSFPTWVMHPQHFKNQYANANPKLINVRMDNGSQAAPAIVLSFELAEKMREALCLGSDFRHTQAAKETQYNKLADLKAKSRLSECKISLLEEKLKSATGNMQEEIEGNLMTAYKKQEALSREVAAEQKIEEYFTDLVSKSRHSFEAGWSKVDTEMRRAFEGSGFVIDPPSRQGHPKHDSKSSECEGYVNNETYIQRECVLNSLSEIVVLAANDETDTQAECVRNSLSEIVVLAASDETYKQRERVQNTLSEIVVLAACDETDTQRECVQNTLSEIVVPAADDFDIPQTLFTGRTIDSGDAVAIRAIEVDYPNCTNEEESLSGNIFRETQQEINLFLGSEQTTAREDNGETNQMTRSSDISSALLLPTGTCISSGPEENRSHQLTGDITRTEESTRLLADFIPEGHEMVLWLDPELPTPATGSSRDDVATTDGQSVRYQVDTPIIRNPERSQYSPVQDQPLNRGPGRYQIKDLWPCQLFKLVRPIHYAKSGWGVFRAYLQVIMKGVSRKASEEKPALEVKVMDRRNQQNTATSQHPVSDQELADKESPQSMENSVMDLETEGPIISTDQPKSYDSMTANLVTELHSEATMPHEHGEATSTTEAQIVPHVRCQHVTHSVLTTVPETSIGVVEDALSPDSEVHNLPIADTFAEEAEAIEQWAVFNQDPRDEPGNTSDERLTMTAPDSAASTNQENGNNGSGYALDARVSVKTSNQETTTTSTEEPDDSPTSAPGPENADSPSPGLATPISSIQNEVTQPQASIESSMPEIRNVPQIIGKRRRSNEESEFLVTKHLKLTTTDLTVSFYASRYTYQAPQMNSERAWTSEGTISTSLSSMIEMVEFPFTYECEFHSPMDIFEEEVEGL